MDAYCKFKYVMRSQLTGSIQYVVHYISTLSLLLVKTISNLKKHQESRTSKRQEAEESSMMSQSKSKTPKVIKFGVGLSD